MNVEPGSLDAGFAAKNFNRRQFLRRVGTGVATLGALSLSAQVLLLAERAARQKRWREILRIERADRRWHAEMGKKSDELCAKIEREWTGKPEDLFMAQLMAVAKMPDQSPPGYYQRSRRCHRCGSRAAYDHRYDANYCPTCNRWLEYGCRNDECAYCGQRPRKPLPKNSSERDRPYLSDQPQVPGVPGLATA